MTTPIRFFLATLSLAFLGASSGHAQAFENDRIYQAYLKIQEAAVAGEYEAALQGINKLVAYNTTNIETAAILRARGFIYLNLKRDQDAIRDFEQALQLQVLNTQMQQEMRYIIANLQASNEQWQDAYDTYRKWLSVATSPAAEKEDLRAPDADAYALGAAIASNVDDFPFAIECTEKAIAISEKPKRELYNLLIALNFQSKNLRAAVQALQRALAYFPNDDEFWKNLSGIYQLIKDDKEALAALVISYEEGLMTSAEEYLLLGRFYLFNEMPFNAAKVITTGMEQGLIPREKDNLDLLSQAWYSAREYEKSLEILKEIVRKTGDEEATLRASQILIDEEKYDQAIELLLISEETGDIEKPGMLHKLKGYAYYGMGEYFESMESFRNAAQADPELQQAATRWVEYIETEFLAGTE